MNKSDKKVTTLKKGADLEVKEAARVVAGALTLNFKGTGYNDISMDDTRGM